MFRRRWRFIAVEWACSVEKKNIKLTASCRNDNTIGWAIEFWSRLYDAIVERSPRTPVAWRNGRILILRLFSIFVFFRSTSTAVVGYDNDGSKLLL